MARLWDLPQRVRLARVIPSEFARRASGSASHGAVENHFRPARGLLPRVALHLFLRGTAES